MTAQSTHVYFASVTAGAGLAVQAQVGLVRFPDGKWEVFYTLGGGIGGGGIVGGGAGVSGATTLRATGDEPVSLSQIEMTRNQFYGSGLSATISVPIPIIAPAGVGAELDWPFAWEPLPGGGSHHNSILSLTAGGGFGVGLMYTYTANLTDDATLVIQNIKPVLENLFQRAQADFPSNSGAGVASVNQGLAQLRSSFLGADVFGQHASDNGNVTTFSSTPISSDGNFGDSNSSANMIRLSGTLVGPETSIEWTGQPFDLDEMIAARVVDSSAYIGANIFRSVDWFGSDGVPLISVDVLNEPAGNAPLLTSATQYSPFRNPDGSFDFTRASTAFDGVTPGSEVGVGSRTTVTAGTMTADGQATNERVVRETITTTDGTEVTLVHDDSFLFEAGAPAITAGGEAYGPPAPPGLTVSQPRTRAADAASADSDEYEPLEVSHGLGASIGASLGSSIGSALAGDNVFARIAAGSVLSATLQTVGSALDTYLSYETGEITLSEAFDAASGQLGNNLAGAFQSQAIGAISLWPRHGMRGNAGVAAPSSVGVEVHSARAGATSYRLAQRCLAAA